MAGKPWSIKDIKAAGNILPYAPHVDARSTSLAEFNFLGLAICLGFPGKRKLATIS